MPPVVDRPVDIRPMVAADARAASVVSARAGERFRAVDEPRIAACADDAPFSPAELEAYAASGRGWVAVEGRTVVGFLVVDIIDRCAHIEEVDVLPAAGGRGHGSRLIEATAAWARSSGFTGVTLTTFRDVPWNAPWYAGLGFRVLSDDELTPGLRRRRALEREHGLPPELRVAMRLDLAGPVSATDALPGQDTLVECWAALAQLSVGARVINMPGAVAAVFPSWAPLNNAIVVDPGEAALAAAELASLYRDAGVDDWALWVPSRTADLDEPDMILDVGPLARDATTLVMHAILPPTLRPHDGAVEASISTLERVSAEEPLPVAELGRSDGQAGLHAWVMVQDGIAVATTWSFLLGTDCGIYGVETLPRWRRRGLGRALVEHVLHVASEQGARTASLQSTAVGQPLYENLGFEAAGRYEEWVAR
jgi:GNAT superfamily N-acetyltransferase